MVDHLASGPDSTGTNARIAAFLIDASFGGPAISAHYALWSAGRWNSNETGDTGAHGLFVHLPALAVRAAGRRVAGIGRDRV